MLENDIKNLLAKSFHDKFSLVKRRENLYQLMVPLYHEDGDMIDIFIKLSGSSIFVCDCGMTLMHLSYAFDINTKSREKILLEIIEDNGAQYEDGNILIPTEPDMLFNNVMQFSQVIAKVSSMRMLRKSNISSIFYENVNEFIFSSLSKYNPQKKYVPIAGQDEHVVDYFLTVNGRPVYLFAIMGEEKALISTIAAMTFQREKLPFMGIAISDSFEKLTTKTKKRVICAMDKLFYDYEDFEKQGMAYFERLAS